MNKHEEEVRKLRYGNIICYRQEFDKPIMVRDIVFDNYKGDIKAIDGGRVTINGEHWYIDDVTVFMNAITDNSNNL